MVYFVTLVKGLLMGTVVVLFPVTHSRHLWHNQRMASQWLKAVCLWLCDIYFQHYKMI